ncbi:MspA family porin [Mycolicibacterium brumae]|uniref:MspA family porin n=1 Tax=Mycolicibacterium brumae TaxID=85968 RepID=UPI000A8CC118|nr:MspA family porin [Mycolicibacterium brumae]RWA20574.1 porin [Mycolicibacterium brumae DSM 44177]UWW07670.1 MspA family porin [Mycolicibacterium brumae]
MSLARIFLTMALAIGALFVGTGTASAGLDNSNTLVDGKGRTMVIEQWDTFLNGVFPLDRNRLTREWFHSGRAVFDVQGEGAEDFEGVLELGYQVGFPWSLGVGINFSYTTPNIAFDGWGVDPDEDGVITGTGLANSIVTPPLLPGVSISADLGNGPGIQEIATFSVDIAGPHGAVAVSNAHGTVTGAAGGVLLRPYARLISNDGDSVTTYGEPWNMN